MPRYFIDVQDGERCICDEDGFELPGLREACEEAIRVLPAIARDLVIHGNPRLDRERLDFVSTVRNEHGLLLFRATFSLSTEWLVTNPTLGSDITR